MKLGTFVRFAFVSTDRMSSHTASGLTQTDGTHLFGKVSPQAIDLVGRFVQTDGYHLSGSHH
jgi:hypothetical protein